MKKILTLLILLLASTGMYMQLAVANQSVSDNNTTKTISTTDTISVRMDSLSFSDYKALAVDAMELAFSKHLNF